MDEYEQERERLQKLWDEVLSGDECDFSPNVSEYEPSDSESSDSDDPLTPRKRCRMPSFEKDYQRVTKTLKFDNSTNNVLSKLDIQNRDQ